MVKWTDHAQAQLRHIHDYIAHDSPLYAKRVSEEMVRKTVGLDELPYLGRKVPELNKEYIHAVVARNRPTDLQSSREIVNCRQFCFINMTGGPASSFYVPKVSG